MLLTQIYARFNDENACYFNTFLKYCQHVYNSGFKVCITISQD